MENLQTLSDKELFEKCQTYGRNARTWLRQFAALLPEVEKRQLYKKYKFYNIYDFAGRLANMNREMVNEILRVARKLEDKPLLKNQLETEGINKVRLVANIATKENEVMWAEKVKQMSKSTLAAFVREFRAGTENGVPTLFDNEATNDGIMKESENGLPDGSSESTNAPDESRLAIRLFLEPETELRLRELQRKLSKEQKSPVTFNEVVKSLLNHYESSRIKRNKKIATEKELEQLKNETCADRYIPASAKNYLHQKYAGRCAFPNCHKLPDIFHHTRRFSLVPNHDPDFLIPLCKNHERLAHLGLIENEEKSPNQWYIREEPDKNAEKFRIDETVNQYRLSNH